MVALRPAFPCNSAGGCEAHGGIDAVAESEGTVHLDPERLFLSKAMERQDDGDEPVGSVTQHDSAEEPGKRVLLPLSKLKKNAGIRR